LNANGSDGWIADLRQPRRERLGRADKSRGFRKRRKLASTYRVLALANDSMLSGVAQGTES